MPKIAFIMGKSASGKDKIYKQLVDNKALQLNTVTLYTTRPKRVGETDGLEYYFVDDEKAVAMESNGRIIELRAYDTVYGVWKYFTADDGQIDVKSDKKYIVIGTLEAYDKFCEYFGRDELLPVYIEVDDGVRLLRAVNREIKQDNPKYGELCRRFLADAVDFSEDNIAKSGIERRFYNNGELNDCIEEITNVILEEM